jgi:hypothetical protein
MEEAKQRVVQRPQVQNQTEIPAEQNRQGIAWRKVSLLATPVVLGLINLVDAYVDKRKAVYEGDQMYRTAVESGRVTADNIRAAAQESGKIIADTLRTTGKKEGESIKRRGAGVAAETVEQGLEESALTRLQAERTRDAVKKFPKASPLDKY